MVWTSSNGGKIAFFLWFLCLAFVTSNLDDGVTEVKDIDARTASPKCEKLRPISLCSNLSHEWTAMPNWSGNENQDDAELEASQFTPLMRVRCSPYLQPLICFAYFPFCSEHLGRLPPCQWMCRRAKRGCEPLMNKFGFEWPEHLRCDRFRTDGLCAGPEHIKKGRCKRIRISTCKDIGYRRTNLPNWAGNDKMGDAEKALLNVEPLIKFGCSSDARLFFCSVYLPQCSRGVTTPPCRSLCLSVRNGCEPLLVKFGFTWPQILNCDRFPTDNCTDGSALRTP